MANAVERWFLLGDSIQSSVFSENGQSVGPACALTASQIPNLANVTIQNLSSPGFRMSQGELPGFGACANRGGLIGGAIGLVPPAGIIIMLGTNDWGNYYVTGSAFTIDYPKVINYCKSMGMKVVCVSPIWHFMQDTVLQHADAGYPLANFRSWIQSMASAAGVGFIDGLSSPVSNCPEYFCDGVHMNEAGHDAFAPWLVMKMRCLGHWM
jgi:lysophospholipase L1-like esterase